MSYKDRERQREYVRTWVAKRRQQWLREHGPCWWCGSWIDLEVDHIDPDRKVTHAVWTWSESRRLAELKKCQVLCNQCHLRKTAIDRRAKVRHGSYVMRVRLGCSCGECLAYHRESKRAWRKKTGKR